MVEYDIKLHVANPSVIPSGVADGDLIAHLQITRGDRKTSGPVLTLTAGQARSAAQATLRVALAVGDKLHWIGFSGAGWGLTLSYRAGDTGPWITDYAPGSGVFRAPPRGV